MITVDRMWIEDYLLLIYEQIDRMEEEIEHYTEEEILVRSWRASYVKAVLEADNAG